MPSFSPASLKRRLTVVAFGLLCGGIALVGIPLAWPAAVAHWLVYGPAARPYWAALTVVQVAALLASIAYLRRIALLQTCARRRLYYAAAAWCLAHWFGWSCQASGLSEPGVVLGYLLTTIWIACCALMAVGVSSMSRLKWLAISSGSLAAGFALIQSKGLDGGGRAMICWRTARIVSAADASAIPLSYSDAASRPGEDAVSDRSKHVGRPARPSVPDRQSEKAPHSLASDFACFRGLGGIGRIDGIELATDWRRLPPRMLWRQSIGSGWGGFAVSAGLAYSQEQRGEEECVVCYEAVTGHERWLHADRVRFTSAIVGDGPRATPSVCDGRVYTLGATGLLNCLDALTGARLWSVDVLSDNGAGNRFHGVSSSPLIFNDMVVVSVGGPGHSLVAYDTISGTRVWQAGDDAAGYGSPVACTVDGEQQIVILNSPGVAAHDPENGAVRWSFPWTNDTETNCSQPVSVGGDRLLISTGYGKGGVLLTVARTADGWSVKPLWTSRNLKTKFCSAVVKDGYAYGLDEGLLTCVHMADGSRCWKAGRYGHGQVLLVNDLLLVQCEDGQIVLVAADSTTHRELARFAALDGKTWNYPALAGRLLLVRNDRAAACFELPTTYTEQKQRSLRDKEKRR